MAFNPFTLLDNNLSDVGDLVSVEIFQAIAKNCNYLIDSMPIGSIVPIMVGFAGCPAPDPLLWQICEGNSIVNQHSALRDNPTPNLIGNAALEFNGRYLRGYINPGTIGSVGGSNSKDLRHTHGRTTVYDSGATGDTDNDFIIPAPHDHGINSDLLANHNFEPVHFRVAHYIKIA